jgi:hypothetical protein
MIDEKLTKIIFDRIVLETSEHGKEIKKRIDHKVGDLSKRGMINSGPPVIMALADVCAIAVTERAGHVWQTTHRFISTSGTRYSETLADELKKMVAQHLPEHLSNIFCFVRDKARLAGKSQEKQVWILSEAEKTLSNNRRHALDKINTEIDLFVISLKNQEERESGYPSSVVNTIYTQQTIIEAGPNAVFNVTQNLQQLIEDVNKASESQISDTAHKKALETFGNAMQDIAKEDFKEAAKQIVTLGKDLGPVLTLSCGYLFFKTLMGG